MKKLFSLIFLFACVICAHADYNRYTVVFTNRTQVGDSNIINGTVSRWTNAPLNNSAWLTTNSIAASATNLQRFIARNYPQYSASITNATNVLVSGADFTVAINGPFGYVTTNTASSTNWHALLLPWANQPFATNNTNDANELISGLNTYPNTALSTGAYSMRHFAPTTNAQLSVATITSGIVTNAQRINTTNLVATTALVGGGYFTNINLQNATGSMVYPVLRTGGSGQSVLVTNLSSSATVLEVANSDLASGSGLNFTLAGTLYWFLSASSNEFNINGTAGNIISLVADDAAVYLGDSGFTVYSLSPLQPMAGITNSTFRGTNVWNGDVAYTSRANSSLVNGANSGIVLGTNVYVRLSGATTVAGISGFTAERDGSLHYVQITGAITNVIVNEANSTDIATDATAANRIITGTGTNLYFTNASLVLPVIYDGTAQRWRIIRSKD